MEPVPVLNVPLLSQLPPILIWPEALKDNEKPVLIVKFPVTVNCDEPSIVILLHVVPKVKLPEYVGQLVAVAGMIILSVIIGTEGSQLDATPQLVEVVPVHCTVANPDFEA